MPHFKEFIDPNFLCNIDFLDNNGQYQRKTVTIKNVTKEEIHNGKGGLELVATVHTGETKPFVLSKKNLKTLIRLTKKINTDDWVGQRIELFISENVKAFGSLFDVIRIADKKIAPAQAVDYTEQHLSLESCTTLKQLQEVYTAFNREQQAATVTTKDKCKTKLTPKENESLNL